MACDSKSVRRRGHHTPASQPSTRILPTTEERLAELGEILAAGLMRLRARKSSGLLHTGADFFLGSLARQSGAVAEVEGDGP
jgi:hypothetical protein